MPAIVIPACNEGRTIERCFSQLPAGGEPEVVVVVCNGCKDDTAARARAFEVRGVIVLERPRRSTVLTVGPGYIIAPYPIRTEQ